MDSMNTQGNVLRQRLELNGTGNLMMEVQNTSVKGNIFSRHRVFANWCKHGTLMFHGAIEVVAGCAASDHSLLYEATRTRAGLQRLATSSAVLAPCQAVMATLHLIYGNYSLLDWSSAIANGSGSAIFLMWLVKKKMPQLSNKATTCCGTVLQIIAFALYLHHIVNKSITCCSTSVDRVLMQHRIFLTSALPFFLFYSVVGYVPSRLYKFVMAPLFYLSWLVFHINVDFLHLPCALFGVTVVIIAGYIYSILDDSEYKRFQATAELDAERQFLQTTKSTLQGMLASLFDASCVCGEDGDVRSCTPQLKEMLVGTGGSGRDVHISNLGEFAVSDTERKRLLRFFRSAAKNAIHRADTIQVSFRSLETGMASAGSVGATLFAIILPGRTTESQCCLFVGFQFQADIVARAHQAPSTYQPSAAVDSHESFIAPTRATSQEWPDSDSSSISSLRSDPSHLSQIAKTCVSRLDRISMKVDMERLHVLEIRTQFAPSGSPDESGHLPGICDWILEATRIPFQQWLQTETNEQLCEMSSCAPNSFGPVFLQWSGLVLEVESAMVVIGDYSDNDTNHVEDCEFSGEIPEVAVIHFQGFTQVDASRALTLLKKRRRRPQRVVPLPAINENTGDATLNQEFALP